MLDLNAVVIEEDPEALSIVGGESRVESSLDAEEGGSGCEFSSMCPNEAESGTSASLVVNAATAEAISPDCEASSQIGKPFSPSYSTRQFFPLEPMDYPLLAPAPFPFPSLSPSPATATATAPAPPTPEFLAKNSQGLPQGIRPAKKSRRGPRSRSSQYRGVTFYRRTGRWESHIWDCGKQIYLGGFNTAHDAARAYDRAAIKFRGLDADINFNLGDYEEDMKQMAGLNKEEFVRALRRQSTGFSRRSSKYTGVTLHKCGRWEARIGPFSGKKYIYLGIFDSEVEAARAYDKAALHCNGQVAMTNFDQNTYEKELSLNGGDDIGMDVVVNFGASPRYKSGTGENTKGLAGPNMARIQGACIGGAQQMEGSIGKEEGKMQPSEGLPLMQPPSLYPTAFAPWHQWFLSTSDGQAQRSFLPPHRFISMGTENPYMQALAHPVEESSLVSKVATGLASSGGMGMKAPLEMGGETSWATKNGPMAASSGFSVQKTTTGFTWLHGSYHKPQSGACVPTCVASNPAMETSSHGPRQVELCLGLSLNSFNKT